MKSLHLDEITTAFLCKTCKKGYEIINNIPQLAVFNETADWSIKDAGTKKYQSHFIDDDSAKNYSKSFSQIPRKIFRTKRELTIVEDLLKKVNKSSVILNLPSGGGRLSEPFSRHCKLLIESDISNAQTQFGKNYCKELENCFWMTSSVFNIPLKNHAVDGTACIRLSHHISSDEDRIKMISELCRISKKYIIFSINDTLSTKAISRRIRGIPLKSSLRPKQVEELFAPFDFHIKDIKTVSNIGSRHRFILLVKSDY